MNKRTALITGATSGIGEATARKLHAIGYQIIATGRREDRLKKLQADLGADRLLTLCFDVRNREAVQLALAGLPESFKNIELLVNNAGNAHGMDLIQDGKWEDWEAMIDINIKGLLAVTQSVLPGMIERKSGHIINLGSIAGDQAYPKGNVYCASKAAVGLLTDTMRIDLNSVGIKVSEIKAGMVDTEFSQVRFGGDKDRANKVYEGMQPLTAEDMAEVIVYMVQAPRHVNLAEVVMLPLAQASAMVVNRS
jgi:3-hydroxy acid dehydrogenase / malonic semialdehyde reductase